MVTGTQATYSQAMASNPQASAQAKGGCSKRFARFWMIDGTWTIDMEGVNHSGSLSDLRKV